jgi:ribosome-associated heat shock protein Hsp15
VNGSAADAAGGAAMRLDKWLWHARFFRSRTLASEFCETTGVRIAGQPVRKAHYQLRVGDVLTFAQGPHVRVIRVLTLSERRVSAALAREFYEDLAPPPPREAAGPRMSVGERKPGSGRPTKADARALSRLRGED